MSGAAGDGHFTEVRLAVGDAQHDDRVPQGGVQRVQVHVTRGGVSGEVRIAGLNLVAAQEARQTACPKATVRSWKKRCR
ncbi:hypothetical protein AQJ91_24580 [Streptomyces dysideae]|uniref:Uncharacterized protein n=1 Tax=Streptomyces dysideae TaxID=909626 RepID=A0A101UXL0_9ACTN|nr:hypothetical protein AQJ91_24580 [Streptomyces dysideae]